MTERPASRKLVSVITPTWQRPDDLADAIETVRAQSYRPLEHVIVSDGHDERLRAMLYDLDQKQYGACSAIDGDPERYVPIFFVDLGRNWSSYLPDSFCAAPLTVGMLLARGDYQTWLADDERLSEDHVESLIDALEAKQADFAYGKVAMWRPGTPTWTIGADPPRCGEITNVLYRADLLKRGLYPFRAGWTSDWACIQRWIEAGATWAFVPRVTMTHRADH